MDYRLRMKLLSGAEISGPMLSVLEKVGIIAVFLFEWKRKKRKEEILWEFWLYKLKLENFLTEDFFLVFIC